MRSPRRALLRSAAVVATVGGVSAVASPAFAWDFPAEEIAEAAAAAPTGGYGGQCKVFAEDTVNQVLAKHGVKARVSGYGTPGGAYFGSYKRAGGVLVAPTAGQAGDLIQVITPGQRHSDSPRTRDADNESVLHTAIILKTIKPGVYQVRDSNYVASGTIGTHRWNPMSWRTRGVEVYVWRFGRAPEPIVVPSALLGAGAEAPRSLKA